MRALLLSLLVAAPAGAQTFRLIDPALTVDNRRVGVAGAPLVQEPFGVLALSVPGAGVFRVSAAPFDGAAAAGEFDGDGLFFAIDGTSVRLRSAGPILDGQASVPAFVRFDALPGATPRTPATGLARASVSDTPGGTPRSSADIAGRATPPRGPASVARPAPDARAEADALRQTLGRVTAERAALEAERDRLRAQRAAQPGGTAEALAQATARSESLTADAERLRAERDQIAAARDRAEDERTRLAGQLDDARVRADAARGTSAQAVAAGDLDRLRADIVARDQTLAALRIESDDRSIRLAETDAALGQVQRALVAMTAERDAALTARDAALTERDAARRDRDARTQGASTPDLTAERAALATERADLDAARARLAADRAALAAAPAGDPSGLLAERQRLLEQITATQSDRDALRLQIASLQSDRERLAGDVARLSSDLATERAISAALRVGAPTPAAAATSRPSAPVASFPDFDFSRLANPDAVRRRVDEAEYPRWAAEGRITGDVLVLFATDASGRVVRTAVATPVGGGLDGLAESLVRDMQFVPPVVDGIPTGLRSQVLVRFAL